MIITIDGPAGSGKSTTAKMLAEHFDFTYLCTGAIYRTLALLINRMDININSDYVEVRFKYKNEILFLCKELKKLKMYIENNNLIVNFDNWDITNLIRTNEISKNSSIVSSFPFVREAILDLQRDYAKHNSIVVEGRDVGSVIFPNADIKFYLTSTVEERANRQFDEINETRTNLKGNDVYFLNIKICYEDIKNAIKERDERDKNREIAPLVVPENGIIIDNTKLTISETFKTFLNHIKKMG